MASDAHMEAVGLVGGDGPAAERVAAVVADRNDLRARLAAYESASVEESAETLAALRALDRCVPCAGSLAPSEARAIREHIRWLTTRYQREHVGRERAEREAAEWRERFLDSPRADVVDSIRSERHDLACRLELFRAALAEARSQRDLAMAWGAALIEQESQDFISWQRALSASVEASAETVAALRQVDCVAAGNGETLLMSEARAIREHIRWLTTRYQREHVGRERAEWQRDEARDARDEARRAQAFAERLEGRASRAYDEARSQCGLAMARGAVLVCQAELWRAAARERETVAQETAGEALKVGDRVRVTRRGWCGSTLYEGEEGELVYVDHDDQAHPFFVKAPAGDGKWSGGWVAEVERAEQPRAELGETDAGEGE
jgi:hypothetical protein